MEYILEDILGRHALESFRKAPVHHAFIGHTLVCQRLVIIHIQRIQNVPYLQKTSLDIRIVSSEIHRQLAGLVIEMTQETFDGFSLGIRKVFECILQGLEIRHIRKELLRIDKILVHIVEIRKDDISPEDEFIQRFRLGIKSLVRIIQLQQKPHSVRSRNSRDPAEEIIYGEHLRSKQRNILHCRAKMFAEPYHRTTVWKDEAFLFNLPFIIIMVCDLFQKRRHLLYF